MSTATARTPRIKAAPGYAIRRDSSLAQVQFRAPRKLMRAVDARLTAAGGLTRSDLFRSLALNWLADPDCFKVSRARSTPAAPKHAPAAHQPEPDDAQVYLEVLGALIARGEVFVDGIEGGGEVVGSYSDGIFSVGVGQSLACVNARLREGGQAPLLVRPKGLRGRLRGIGALVEDPAEVAMRNADGSWRTGQETVHGVRMRLVKIRSRDLLGDASPALAAKIAGEPARRAVVAAPAVVVAAPPKATNFNFAPVYLDPSGY